MKKFKRIMALVIALAMVVAMALPALADVTPADVSEAGSITISSPVMGAKYEAYQVFEMTANAEYDALSYTIKDDASHPFYTEVAAYAASKGNYPDEETGKFADGTDKKGKPKSGLILTPSANDAKLFNVSVTEDFDPQAFGQYLKEKLKGKPATATEGAVAPTITGATAEHPDFGYHGATKTDMAAGDAVTVATSSSVTFDKIPLGYYLILSEYAVTEKETATLYLDPSNTEGTKWVVKKAMIDDPTAKNDDDKTLEQVLDDYITQKITTAFVDDYIAANPDKVRGTGVNGEITAADKTNVTNQLKKSYREDALQKLQNAFTGSASDDNAQEIAQRMVFVDSTTPDVDIKEKNEIEKWDIPVNPEGTADLKPFDEPEGGKNIVIREGVWDAENGKWTTEPVYGHATEANIGDKVHYQLSLNAVNFERIKLEGETEPSVKQIKQYIVADYQNKNMTFVAKNDEDPESGIKVSIVKKETDGTVKVIEGPVDYSAWSDKFFHNTKQTDITKTDGKYPSLFTEKGGMVIPWVEEVTPTTHPGLFNNDGSIISMANVTTTEEPSTDNPAYLKGTELTPKQEKAGWQVGTGEDAGYILDKNGARIRLKDKDGNPAFETTTHYFKSLYPDDVTILVDYWMILNDTAVIDGTEGNVNVSQYGVDYTKPTDYSYTPPTPDGTDEKPDSEKDHSDAELYTYALAIHKVDDEWQDLDGAKFRIKGLKATKVQNGWYKVNEFDATADKFTNNDTEMETDAKGWLIIEGLMTSQKVTIEETQAPDGYNKMAGTLEASPIETGHTIITESTVTEKDSNGNVTKTVVTKTIDGKKLDGGGYTSIEVTTTEDGVETKTYEITNKNDQNTLEEANLKAEGVAFKVVNNKGTELPSTGGIGTTIFYVVGAILVIGAGVVLITRRRMDG